MQATTRVTRWRARHWKVQPWRQRPTRTLTYREVWRRAKVPGIYPRSLRGAARAFRDVSRATAHPLAVQTVLTIGLSAPPRITSDDIIAQDAARLRG